jgi:hypothetical protein
MFYDDMIDLQGVQPGGVAVLKISYKATIDKVHFFLGGGLTKADITRIEGKANGVTFFVDDATKLKVRDDYASIFSDASIVTLDFTEPNTRGGAPAQYLASIPRNLLSSLTFEVTIAAGANAASTMRAKAEYRGPTQNEFILRRKDFNIALPIVGENDLILPSDVNGGLVKRIWVHHTGNVNKAELRTDAVPILRTSVADLQYAQKRNKVVPQANLLTLDFLLDGNLMNMLDTSKVSEAFMRITTTAADTAKIYIDYIDSIKRLK